MKSIYFSEEHALFRKSVRDFLEAEVAPHADAWEAARKIPRAIWRRMGEMGFLGIPFPESLGGAGADVFYSIAFLEELPRSRMGGFCAAVGVQEFIATGAIFRRGTDEQRRRFLVPSIEGRAVGAIAISEPDCGSDVAAIRTAAVREGDAWVVNGAKTWITNGVEADFLVVAVKTDASAGSGGISLLAFDADVPGLSRTKLRKMGWHSSDTAELVFENVRVPLDALVGEENAGFFYVMETFALERIVAAAQSVGACDLALEETLRYMESRKAFGRPLAKFQALRHRLADLFAELAAVRQLVYHAAWLHEQGAPCVAEAAMAKLLASELNKKAADECLQFHGGYGYVEEYPIERFFRDARVSTIVAGTSEIMREIVAKAAIDGVTFAPAPPVEAQSAIPAAASAAPADPLPAPAAPAAPPAPAASPAPPPPAGSAGAFTLEALFLSLPSRQRADKTEGWRAVFHFLFEGSATPEWTVSIDGPTCSVSRGLHGAPDCVVRTKEDVYVGIETGSVRPETAFLMGRVKVSNLAQMTRYVKAFRPAVG